MTATTRLQELIGSIREGETVNVMVAMERNHQRQKIPTTTHQMLEDIKAELPTKHAANMSVTDEVFYKSDAYGMVNATIDEVTAVLERYFGEGEHE